MRTRITGYIDGLLEKATKVLAANRLTTPAGDIAAKYAGRVLVIRAGHPGAKRMLQEAIGRYVALGEVVVSTGRLDEARRYQRTAAAPTARDVAEEVRGATAAEPAKRDGSVIPRSF